MKKLYILSLFCLVTLGLIAQPVTRQKVIVEIATGTWCTFCPGAAMGADDLVANGCQVGNIEYHNGDPFANTASDARNAYYAVSGYPTAHFDGVLSFVGGSHTESMYPNYLPLYQQRMAVPSDFLVDIYGQNTGSVYDIALVITKVNGTWGSLTVQLALTESEIVYSWQGQDHLNFVERLMAPDHLGTTVDFTGVETITVPLQFTINSTWVAANCEIVAFVQNETTKEILQGNMVAIPDLEPMVATAGFSCSDETPCITTTVEFEDESMGDIISWNWTFEGGNPPTSSVENPVITYNTQGQYDVSLIVYDGEVYDTLVNPEYILVITPPVQPNTPSGPTAICQDDTGIQYSIPVVQWATTYAWDVEPDAAGTIAGPDPVATFTQTPGYLGSYTIKARADNDCGTGTWSQGLNCTAFLTPAQYTLSDGAGYCEGSEGIQVTLDGSQEGVSYELYLDGDPTGLVEEGTGSALDFGFQTEQGIYTCVAFTDNCESNMIGNSYIYVINAPAEPETPSGPAIQCNNLENVTYTTEDVTGATSYEWSLTPSEAGTITGEDITGTVNWSPDYSGTAQISVAAVNSCATGPSSDNLSVIVNEAPEPAISGDQDVCDWEAGFVYSTQETEGNTYTWELYNGHITAGEGTGEVTVTWHDYGTGWIKVTETSANCSEVTANFDIVINDCVGIGENENTSFSICPNPVKDELQVSFAGKNTDCKLIIVNQLGQVILDRMTGDGQQLIINTSEYAKGVYALRVYGANGVTEKKFIKFD
jgi:PKD repeat protein